MTWEWTLAKPLLVVHALAGFSVLAMTAHLIFFGWRGTRESGLRFRPRAARCAAILWPLLVLSLVTGMLIYPAFRVGVRAAWLDQSAPLLTGLFEIKEHAGAMAFPLALGLWLFFRRWATLPTDGSARLVWMGETAMAVALALIALFNVIVGLLLVSVRSI